MRAKLDPAVARCPFCTFEERDPRLVPMEAIAGGRRWFALHNIYPPLEGPTGTAELACAVAHDPTLTHLHEGLADDWAAMLDVQRQLAGQWPQRWSLLSAATGPSAGASQHHPHGQVLTPAVVPPETQDRQRRWADPQVVARMLEDATVVEERGGVRLFVPPVPLSPLDLWLAPVAAQRLEDVDTAAFGHLVARWVAGVHRLSEEIGSGAPRVGHAAPFDAKVAVHPQLPDGTGRWWAELCVTEQHAPGVTEVPLIDLRWRPSDQAARFRAVAGRPEEP